MAILFCGIFFHQAGAQKIESPFNEYGFSVNRTNVSNDNTEDRTGFGIGAYHSPAPDSEGGFMIGFEYNHTSQFKKRVFFMDHFGGYEKDVTYDFDYITFLFAHRFHFEAEAKILIDLGGFLDIGISSVKEGISHSCYQFPCADVKFKKSYGSLGLFPGIAFGIGIKIPVLRYQFILKPEYKFCLLHAEDGEERFSFNYYRLLVGIKIN